MIAQTTRAILVLNAGSSSLKFSVYDATHLPLALVSRGQLERLGAIPRFEARDGQGSRIADELLNPSHGGLSHRDALTYLSHWLGQQYADQLRLEAVGHRMAHGGPGLIEPTLIDDVVLETIEKIVPLAPLHLPHNLAGVKAVRQVRPDLSQVACFDTAFHRNRSSVTERFGLPNALFEAGLKRWGFHGLSYESIARQFGKLEPNLALGRVVVAHLGNGASLCAMKAGRSVDTTMSFSTLDGLPMATRCGSLDPGVLLHLLRQMTPEELEKLLYQESGLLGISGIGGDMRTLLASADRRAIEAVEYFVYRIVQEIGSMTAALGGIDALIFTAGIGENSAVIRARVCEGLAWLGIKINPGANECNEKQLSPAGCSPSVWMLSTDEEGVIAEHTYELLLKKSQGMLSPTGGKNVPHAAHR